MTLHEYALKVLELRTAQQQTAAIFRDVTAKPSARTAALEHSRKLEREIDRLTKQVLTPAPMPELFTAPEN